MSFSETEAEELMGNETQFSPPQRPEVTGDQPFVSSGTQRRERREARMPRLPDCAGKASMCFGWKGEECSINPEMFAKTKDGQKENST